MKRRRVLFLAAAAVLAATAFFVWPNGPKEPVHQGKALTQWINEAVDVGIFEQTDETKAAMIAFGTNAVPFLVNEFIRPVSRRQDGVADWINRLSPFHIHIRTGAERVRLAGRGLQLLETNAAPALPVLMRYLDDPERDWFVKSISDSIALPRTTP